MLEATLALAAQAALMAVDELYFHRRRGLERFERWSHPIDTLFFALALLVPTRHAPTPGAEALYIGLAILSTLLITKDEWIHARACCGGEQWLHACLFVLHPVALLLVGNAWRQSPTTPLALTAPWPILAFMVYQLVYWMVLRDALPLRRPAARGQQRVLR